MIEITPYHIQRMLTYCTIEYFDINKQPLLAPNYTSFNSTELNITQLINCIITGKDSEKCRYVILIHLHMQTFGLQDCLK